MTLDRVFRALAALACAGLPAIPHAQQPAWALNSWGSRPTVVTAEQDEARCGTAGFHFVKSRQGDGEAELVWPEALKAGQAYRFTVRVKRLAGQGWVDLYFRKSGPHYETTAIRSFMPRADPQTVVLEGIYDGFGPGAVRMGLRDEGQAVCLSSARLEAIGPENIGERRPRQLIDASFFGIHLNKLGTHNGWPSFDPGVVRMWDTGTTWADIQPSPGPIDWRGEPHAQRFDYFASHVRRFNAKASLLVTLGMTPTWAAAGGPGGCGGNLPYGARACMPPADMSAWRAYVRALAQRYKGRARYWEVLNEADVPMHWNGSARQLVEMTRIAREEIKAADPGNVLMGPNITAQGLRLLNEFFRHGGDKYIDAVSIHFYIGRSPQLALSKLRNAQQLLRAWGLNLPIWNTEAGTSCTPDFDCDAVMANRAATDGVSALAQAYLGQAAQGVRHISYYTWEGGVVSAGGLPLVQRDRDTPTQAGRVLETLKDWMVGAEVSWLSGPDDRIKRVALMRRDRVCTAAWVEAGEAVLPVAQLSNAEKAIDALGQAVLSQSDRYRLGALPVLGCAAVTGKSSS